MVKTIMEAAVPPPQLQCTRWVFTLNNYNSSINYVDYFKQFDSIKRCVWGFERAPETGTNHLQGYLEYVRSQRLNTCRTIFSRARWSKAVASPAANFNYCVKGGSYGYIGDWTRELTRDSSAVRSPSVPMVLSALINPVTEIQIKVCKEYAERCNYYDRISKLIKKIIHDKKYFDEWATLKLYPWQYIVSIGFVYLIYFNCLCINL